MAAKIKQLREWLETFPPNWTIYIDEGGLTLVAKGSTNSYPYEYELGGEPNESKNNSERNRRSRQDQ